MRDLDEDVVVFELEGEDEFKNKRFTEMCCGRGGLVFKAHRLLYHSA